MTFTQLQSGVGCLAVLTPPKPAERPRPKAIKPCRSSP